MNDNEQQAENNRMLYELLGAIRGINGDGGLIGRIEKMGGDVQAILVTLPTLTTKESCIEIREKCAILRGANADHKWMRRKDAILVILASLGGVGTFVGIGNAVGWFR